MLCSGLGRRVLLELQQHLGKAGVQADDVAALDFYFVLFNYFLQVVKADGMPLPAEVRVQVDHHAAALHAVLGEVLDAERLRARALEARPGFGVRIFFCRNDIVTGPIAVVKNRFRLAVAVGVEDAADVREGIPLRRVLQREQHEVVADHVGLHRVLLPHRVGEVLPAVALRGGDARRMAPRIEHVAAGIVERQRQHERDAPPSPRATPCSTFSRVTQFMRPRWSSGPKSPQFESGGRCFQRALIRR